MVRIINQETFDDAVRENKELFDLETEDAVKETIQQFEKQGVDLSNIIKDLSLMSENPGMEDDLRNKMDFFHNLIKKTDFPDSELIETLETIRFECDKDIAHRLLVGKMDGYCTLGNLINKYHEKIDVELKLLETMTALMDGQPDLLNPSGIDLMNKLLTQTNTEIRIATLKWIKICCIKHENNRQNIFNSNILQSLKDMLKDPTSLDAELIRQVCAVCRALVLDDDIRVEFGHAHDHAKAIASDTMQTLLELLKEFKTDQSVVSDLMLTVAALLVRAEFCKIVQEAGGIDFVLEVLVTFAGKEKVAKQALKLIKALAGNDDCKYYIVNKGGSTPICAVLDQYKENAGIAHVGLTTIAALTLRAPENSDAFYSAGAPDLIIDCMKLHFSEWKIQQAASWVIRNMVSRNKQQIKHFISLGAETELNRALQKYASNCAYDLKSALRDLGCNVVLKEEWTGKGGKIFTEESISNFQNRYD